FPASFKVGITKANLGETVTAIMVGPVLLLLGCDTPLRCWLRSTFDSSDLGGLPESAEEHTYKHTFALRGSLYGIIASPSPATTLSLARELPWSSPASAGWQCVLRPHSATG